MTVNGILSTRPGILRSIVCQGGSRYVTTVCNQTHVIVPVQRTYNESQVTFQGNYTQTSTAQNV